MRNHHLSLGLLFGSLLLLGAGCYGPKPANTNTATNTNQPSNVACTQEAKLCPDGSSVGRMPPSCEFAPCPPGAPDKSDLIRVTTPKPGDLVTSPIAITGEARGTWYFEASFPVKLLDADGNEVAAFHAQALGDWMTTDFVPFSASLPFVTPKTATGTLVLQKDNPSGLPEHDDQITIPVRFR
jgi:hypothetical protein